MTVGPIKWRRGIPILPFYRYCEVCNYYKHYWLKAWIQYFGDPKKAKPRPAPKVGLIKWLNGEIEEVRLKEPALAEAFRRYYKHIKTDHAGPSLWRPQYIKLDTFSGE